MSGVEIPVELVAELEKIWRDFTPSAKFSFPEEALEDKAIFEGKTQQINVNRYERSNKARKSCIDHYGSSCIVCDFNFKEVFGEIGEGFIHVHHLSSLSEIKEHYEVDPMPDLRPVCPNCHAMIYRRVPPFRIDELKIILNQSHSSDK